MSRATIEALITQIENETSASGNSKKRIANLLRKINQEKFDSSDTLSKNDILSLVNSNSEFKNVIDPGTIFTPEVSAWGFAGEGTYPNADDIIVNPGKVAIITFDGDNFSSLEIDLPQAKKSIINFADIPSGEFPLENVGSEKVQVIENNSIFQLKDGESAGVGDVPGDSDKWEVLGKETSNSTDLMRFLDSENNIVGSVDKDGVWNLPKIKSDDFPFKEKQDISIFTIEDKEGNVLANVDKDGVWNFSKINPENLKEKKQSNLEYTEIGDSISDFFDTKKETRPSAFGSETGYVGCKGYGQRICDHFGITYENHRVTALSGNTFCDIAKGVKYPPNSDTFWNVSKKSHLTTIFLGTNDFALNVAFGTKSDYINNTFDAQNDTNRTIYGGIRVLIDTMRTSGYEKHKAIVFITPFKSTYTHQKLSSGEIVEKTNSQGKTMSDVVNIIKWCAGQTGARVIDLYNNDGFFRMDKLNLNNENPSGSWSPLTDDGVHPLAVGQKLLFQLIIKDIEQVLLTNRF